MPGTKRTDPKRQPAGNDNRAECERKLDEGLEETFPASDPPSKTQPVAHGPAGDPSTKP